MNLDNEHLSGEEQSGKDPILGLMTLACPTPINKTEVEFQATLNSGAMR